MPVIAEGGRLSMDAFYIDEVSYTWGSYIEETGHHVGSCKNGVENPRIDVTDGAAEDLPFDDSQFDFALMVTTICFLDDVELGIKEAYRVIKNGGSLIIGFVDKTSTLGQLYLKHKNESVFYKPATFYSTGEVVTFLEKAGFSKFSFVQTIFRSLADIKAIEPLKKGYGSGSFVVVKEVKYSFVLVN